MKTLGKESESGAKNQEIGGSKGVSAFRIEGLAEVCRKTGLARLFSALGSALGSLDMMASTLVISEMMRHLICFYSGLSICRNGS